MRKILSILLVILWMLTIFYFSHQQGTGSSSTSKKVSIIIINIFDVENKIPQEEKVQLAKKVEPFVRKLAHFTIYILGGITITNCINTFKKIEITKTIEYSSIIGVLYAISDETHQLFVNGRSGKIEDILIDTIGVLTGITMYLLVIEIVNKLKNKRGRIN